MVIEDHLPFFMKEQLSPINVNYQNGILIVLTRENIELRERCSEKQYNSFLNEMSSRRYEIIQSGFRDIFNAFFNQKS